jgi:hypothetical protein
MTLSQTYVVKNFLFVNSNESNFTFCRKAFAQFKLTYNYPDCNIWQNELLESFLKILSFVGNPLFQSNFVNTILEVTTKESNLSECLWIIHT